MPKYTIKEYVEYVYCHEIEADSLEEALTKIANSEFPVNEAQIIEVSYDRDARNTEDGQVIDPKRFRAACDNLNLICP